jgi:proton-translocating NADH-quinone oxidoreductase chain M
MDLLTFYIFFESILIPMFLVIGIWGSRERKIQAAYQFLLYTLLGSLFMLVAIIYLWLNYQTTDILLLSYHSFSLQEEKVLWLLLFLSFVVKIPLFPFHIWLPEAHVEAPTAGSVILAGILLKLGGYGFLRISLTLFPHATTYFSPLVLLLSTLSILYISLTAIRQIDLKKIIAYSSISHMGFVTFALVTNQLSGLQGALLSMVSHGLVASALFFVVGLLYDRHKTRILSYYRGLAIPMPLAASLNFLVILANIGLPLTSSFVGELMTLTSLYHTNKITTLLVSFALLLTPIYSLSYFNKAFFGSLTPYLSSFRDLTFRELMILVPLVVMILYLGIAPNGLFLMISSSLASLISS